MKMKTNLITGVLMVTAIVQLASCGNDDDKPKTLPTVVTGTDITTTTTTANVTGEITDTGNDKITEAGFVYSINVTVPTMADNKKTVTDFEEFTAELTGLSSGTDYYIRAYATNSKGTAYGDVETFETGNLAPVASNIQINGDIQEDKDITVTFTYTDAEGDAPGEHVYQWYVANDGAGAGETVIAGATNATYRILAAQNGKHFKVTVTPKAQAGTITGETVTSTYTGAVGAETVSFTYNNLPVTYGTITSATTGKKWLDRNLGASRAATAIDDYLAYGDLFQGGRAADRHQLIARINGTNEGAEGVKGMTSAVEPYETSDDDTPETNKFIINPIERDWRTTANDNLWQGVNGINNPCPVGWRIPTQAEWIAENLGTSANAFTVLKLTRSGRRNVEDGTFVNTGSIGQYWSSTPDAVFVDQRRNNTVNVGSTNVTIGQNTGAPRGYGYACRCIKD